jgi:conjugative relaxase-like TrwC/TraI family protein
MLEIRPIRSSCGAVKYFDSALAQSDYYTAEIGKWGGKGAERLELSSTVERKDFIALIRNHRPDGEKLTARTRANRRSGYELVFSAPKSVSILHAAGDPGVGRFYREAVRETLAEIESDVQVRMRKGGEQRQNRVTGELVYASFMHKTSRPIDGVADPHLHTHVIGINATFDRVEGQWKAVEFGQIKRDGAYHEQRFHQRLKDKLLEQGYELRPTDRGWRQWEIKAITDYDIERFSRRTEEVELAARSKGLTGHAKAALGTQTRQRKESIQMTHAEQLREWRVRFGEERWNTLSQKVKVANLEYFKTWQRAKTLHPVRQAVDHMLAQGYRVSVRVQELATRLAKEEQREAVQAVQIRQRSREMAYDEWEE